MQNTEAILAELLEQDNGAFVIFDFDKPSAVEGPRFLQVSASKNEDFYLSIPTSQFPGGELDDIEKKLRDPFSIVKLVRELTADPSTIAEVDNLEEFGRWYLGRDATELAAVIEEVIALGFLGTSYTVQKSWEEG